MFAYKTLKSGTDIRGVASEGGGAPINLTDEVVERIAAGFLVWCEKHLDKCAEGLKIAVGHDSRISADRIAAALFRAFTTYGASVYDCGLASTPSMFMAVLELPCDCSVQITASHHPFFRNGLKFFTPAGALTARIFPRFWNMHRTALRRRRPTTARWCRWTICQNMQIICAR